MTAKKLKETLEYVSILIIACAFGVMFAALMCGADTLNDVLKMLIGG